MSELKEYTTREIGIVVENIQLQVKNGFKGVYERQDYTNGTVKEHAKRLNKSDAFQNKVKGALIVMNVMLIPLLFLVIQEYIKK